MEGIIIPRGRNPRIVRCDPSQYFFKPRGIPLKDIQDQVDITIEEIEAMRLTDLEGINQREAAEKMRISQSTISRHLESAHRKIAKALLLGLAIRIANPSDYLHCEECGHISPILEDFLQIDQCDNCESSKIHFHIHSDDEHRIQSVKSNK
ncbi:MAG: DUF134 domain-containing protein [Candidatus Hodarchaeales archaeon]